MSYALSQEKKTAEKPEIAMPPLPPESVQETIVTEPISDQELKEVLEVSAPEQAEAQQVPENPFAYNNAQDNMRNMREAKERAERERDEAIRILREASQRQQPQVEEDVQLAPDEYVEWKHVDKKMKKLENELKRYQQQTYEMSVEAKLKAEHSDFDRIVTQENIASLREKHPQLAQSLDYNPDLYSKASSAYLLIKQLGIVQDPMEQLNKERALKNIAKPRPATSAAPQQGSSPLEQANAFSNGLTDQLSKQLHKEMLDAIKNR